MSALNGIPRHLMPLFDEIVGGADPAMHDAIVSSQRPTLAQRRRVMEILSDAFSGNLRPDWEPTPRGVQIDDLLGKFLMQFPFDLDDPT